MPGVSLKVPPGVVALVLSDPRERVTSTGTGANRQVTGRVVDAEGRPVSSFSALLVGDQFGLIGDSSIDVPDSQVTGLVTGAAVRLEGAITLKISGGDYGAVRSKLTAERLSPLGDGMSALTGLNGRAKPAAA